MDYYARMECDVMSGPVIIALIFFAIDIVNVLMRKEDDNDDKKESKMTVLVKHLLSWGIFIAILGLLSGKCYNAAAWVMLLTPFLITLLSVIVFVSVIAALVVWKASKEKKIVPIVHPAGYCVSNKQCPNGMVCMKNKCVPVI